MQHRYGSHTAYNIKYHFVWVTKHRYKVLTGASRQFTHNAFLATKAILVRNQTPGNGIDLGANSHVIDSIANDCAVIRMPARIFCRHNTGCRKSPGKSRSIGDEQ